MFGPYDSRKLCTILNTDMSEPPTRPHTVLDTGLPPSQGRPTHPFVYDASQTLPFAALSSDQQHTRAPQKGSGARLPTRESEVMSRGAGLGRPPALGPVIGQDTNPDPTGSVGMGTFGQDSGKQNPNIVSADTSMGAKILNFRIKGIDRQTKVLLMETLRITHFLQARSPNQSLPRSNEYLFQSTTWDNTSKPSHPNNRMFTLPTTTSPSRTPKRLRNSKKPWKKPELKRSPSSRTQSHKANPLVVQKVQGARTRRLPAVLHLAIFFIKTGDP